MQSLGASDDGGELRLAIGEQFSLALSETPTTGFRWTVSALPQMLTVEHDEFVAPDPSRPGAGGEHRWVFRTKAAGDATLTLDLASAVRRSADPRRFALQIKVGAR